MAETATATASLNVENPPSAAYPSGPQDTTWWDTMVYVWDKVDGALAGFFGLNQSKYQWAIDEYNRQRLQEEQASAHFTPAAQAAMKQQAEVDDKLESQPPPAQLMLETATHGTEGHWKLVRG